MVPEQKHDHETHSSRASSDGAVHLPSLETQTREPSCDGLVSLLYRSDAELIGSAVLATGPEFNQSVQALCLEFGEEIPLVSAQHARQGWRMVSQIGAIVSSPVDTDEIKLSLDLADLAETLSHAVDVFADRLAVLVTK